jgi:hypothetical protein
MNRLNRVVLVLLCFELGVLLVLIPWSAFWERNFFLDRYPQMIPVLLNSYLRGAISGLGLLDIWIAATLLRPRKSARPASS